MLIFFLKDCSQNFKGFTFSIPFLFWIVMGRSGFPQSVARESVTECWFRYIGRKMTKWIASSSGDKIASILIYAHALVTYEKQRCWHSNPFPHVWSGDHNLYPPAAAAYWKQQSLQYYRVLSLFIYLLFQNNNYFGDIPILLNFS